MTPFQFPDKCDDCGQKATPYLRLCPDCSLEHDKAFAYHHAHNYVAIGGHLQEAEDYANWYYAKYVANMETLDDCPDHIHGFREFTRETMPA